MVSHQMAQLSYNHTFPVRCHRWDTRLSACCSFKSSCVRKGLTWEVHEGKLMPDETNIVVKVCVRADLRTEWECLAQVMKNHHAKLVLDRCCSQLSAAIEVLGSLYAEVQKLGYGARHITDRKHRTVRETDFVVVQNKVSQPIQTFLLEDGTTRGDHPLLQAFSHASYHFSDGEYVISGMKGLARGTRHGEKAYTLTSFACHSRSLQFGSNDLGEEGIKLFFENHQCTDLCVRMKIYGVDHVLPSAPPPDEFSDENSGWL